MSASLSTNELYFGSVAGNQDAANRLAGFQVSSGHVKLVGATSAAPPVLSGFVGRQVVCATATGVRMTTGSTTQGEFNAVDATLDTIEHATVDVTDLATIWDGVDSALWNVVGARVLVRTALASNASGGAEATNHPMNGVYVVTVVASGGAKWKAARAGDFSTGAIGGNVRVGDAFWVANGTLFGQTQLVVTDNWTGDLPYPAAVGFYNGNTASLNAEAANFISFALPLVKAGQVSNQFVTSSMIADNAIQSNLIASNAVQLSKISFTAGGTSELAATPAADDLLAIYDTSATTMKYIQRSNLVAGASVPSGTSAQFIVYDSGNAAAAASMSGDATLSNTGAVTLAATQANVATLANSSLVLGATTQRISLATSGKINFGTSGTANYAYVDLAGGQEGKVYGTSFNTTSDIRAKSNMEAIEDASGKVLSLPAFTFEYNGKCGRPEGFQSAGTSAQALQAVLPCAVTVGEDGYLSVAYDCLHALHLACAQEQIARVGALEARIAALELVLKGKDEKTKVGGGK